MINPGALNCCSWLPSLGTCANLERFDVYLRRQRTHFRVLELYTIRKPGGGVFNTRDGGRQMFFTLPRLRQRCPEHFTTRQKARSTTRNGLEGSAAKRLVVRAGLPLLRANDGTYVRLRDVVWRETKTKTNRIICECFNQESFPLE